MAPKKKTPSKIWILQNPWFKGDAVKYDLPYFAHETLDPGIYPFRKHFRNSIVVIPVTLEALKVTMIANRPTSRGRQACAWSLPAQDGWGEKRG
jgi:hypothetical protein